MNPAGIDFAMDILMPCSNAGVDTRRRKRLSWFPLSNETQAAFPLDRDHHCRRQAADTSMIVVDSLHLKTITDQRIDTRNRHSLLEIPDTPFGRRLR